MSHGELDAASTPLRPVHRHRRMQKLAPGERVPVEIEILPASTLFRAGETLVVRIQGTELPGAGDITHIDGVNSGTHIVHVGGPTDSHLAIPVIVSD